MWTWFQWLAAIVALILVFVYLDRAAHLQEQKEERQKRKKESMADLELHTPGPDGTSEETPDGAPGVDLDIDL